VADPGTYLEAAASTEMKIDYVFDTHVHADHLSTGPALAAVAGAHYILSSKPMLPFRSRG
jgi:glyoxylase-like metal-dependent hydrolase (beta-lactamase superfamily II)